MKGGIKMKTTLENLIQDVSKNKTQFANAVGVSQQKLRQQLKSKNQINFAVQYAIKLGINKVYGFEYGCDVEIVINQKK
jgi:hypothetical protein